jgi:hypothetical protein
VVTSPFTIHPGVPESEAAAVPAGPSTDASLGWPRLVRWLPLGAVLALGCTWCAQISVPGGPHVFVALLLAAFASIVVAAVAVLVGRFVREGPTGLRRSVAVWLVLASVALVAVATATDAPARWRFEQHRGDFEHMVQLFDAATSESAPGTTNVAASFSWKGTPYGAVTIRDEMGGVFFLTHSAGEGPETGFVYLPTIESLTAWESTHGLRRLGGDWYLTP